MPNGFAIAGLIALAAPKPPNPVLVVAVVEAAGVPNRLGWLELTVGVEVTEPKSPPPVAGVADVPPRGKVNFG